MFNALLAAILSDHETFAYDISVESWAILFLSIGWMTRGELGGGEK